MGLCPRCLFANLVDPTETAPTQEKGSGVPLNVGSRVGDYELLEVLGCGSQGVVWRGRHCEMDREVALKLLLEPSAFHVRLFQREVVAIAKLDHPNIVRILEVGEHQGYPYFTMDLMSGGSLDGFEGEPRRAAELMEKVARGVHHLHQREIVHRDLKPANILLDRSGEPKVTDFGVAKHTDKEHLLTRTGVMIGTPLYMAPEHVDGHPTALSDVYSLGVILYEMLTGSLPFEGKELIKHIKNSPPKDPRALNPRIERDLALICLRCLEKDPEHRYGSAEALAVELRKYLDGRPIEGASRAERAWRWCLRHSVKAALVLAASWLLPIAALGAVWTERQEEVKESSRISAGAVAEMVLSYLRDLSDDVHQEAADPRLGRILEEADEDDQALDKSKQQLNAICDEMYSRHKDPSPTTGGHDDSPYYVWFIQDKGGNQRGHVTHLKGFNRSYAGRDYFLQAKALGEKGLRQTYVSYAFKGVPRGLYEFAISAPIYGSDNKWKGVLVAAVATKVKLGQLILDDGQRTGVLAAPLDPTSGQDTSIVPTPRPEPPEYRIVRHPDYTNHGEAIELENRQVSKIGWDSQEGDKHVTHWYHQELNSTRWWGSSDDYADPLSKGHRRIAGFAPVGHTGFVAIVQSNPGRVPGLEKWLPRRRAPWAAIATAPGVLLVLFAAMYDRRRRARRAPRKSAAAT
jgi:serine/threonine-protein kinase